MAAKKSESIFSKIFVGVAVTVISAIILSNLGLGDKPTSNPAPSPVPPAQQQQQVQMAGWCCDVWGNKRCQLINPVAVGSSCFCPGQGSGVACQ